MSRGKTARSSGYLGRMWAGEMIEGFIHTTEKMIYPSNDSEAME